MGKKQITPRELVRENWMSFSSVLERLELYYRFLPIYYNRAKAFQNKIENSQPVAPFEFDLHKSPFPDIPPLAPKDWIHYMQSPLMEWEIYWESVYKLIYSMNHISGYKPAMTARAIYKENLPYLESLEGARHTFAHFVKFLPSIKDYTAGKIIHGATWSKEDYIFRESKWSTSEKEYNKFLSICSSFIDAANSDFSLWAKTISTQVKS